MVENYRTKLLEVSVVDRTGDRRGSWEWQVRTGDKLVVSGYETNRIAAKFAGNDAMFLLLAANWTQ